MSKQQHPNQQLIQFILRAQQIALKNDRPDRGYAMMVVSIVSVVLFSMLAACLTISNLSKLSTNAYVDGTNTFYAAESGLNKRANELREKFAVSLLPTSGSATTPASVSECFLLTMADTANVNSYDVNNDFGCRNYRFKYANKSATLTSSNGSTEATDRVDTINYIAYTSVKPKQDYSTIQPDPQIISPGEPFAGLSALEYKYTVSATAKKVDAANSGGNATTVLQMDFKSRVVPLFQFAAFYEDDLEMNSATPMSVSGPVHTNGNLKAVSYTDTSSSSNFTLGTRLMDKVTAVLDIYDRTPHNNGCITSSSCGAVSVYKGSGDKALSTNYGFFPTSISDSMLTTAQLAVFGDRLKSRTTRLNPPAPGFLREKNYVTNQTGLYYGKADLRLKFFPGRAMPFDFTSIQDGTGCDLTANKIPSDRQHANALSCLKLTKGQLHSLRQPVLTRSTSTTALSPKNQGILKALRVAIAASPTPITLSALDSSIDTSSGWGKIFKERLAESLTAAEINTLLPSSPGPSPAATTALSCTASTLPTTGKATDIVQALCSKFLPAPIQQITGTANSVNPKVNGSFYNQIQSNDDGAFSTTNGSWIEMLQINIGSLTYWNRDGIYVEADAGNKDLLTTAYGSPTTLTLALGISTDNLAFIKAVADTTKPVSSFAYQGLAARDVGLNSTEGGLVFYANVSDDTNGDGTNNITAPNTNPAVPGKDASGNSIARVDNQRSYPGLTGIRKSPYGFVISGAVELPGPLTIATDQAAYIQGDYNNPGVVAGSLDPTASYYPSNDPANDRGYRRQPAAIMADTITFLSNECSNDNQQVNCGINTTLVGDRSVVTNGIAINAALLSSIMKSTSGTFNGGLNKYMKHLENWGFATALNYTGSMVSLGEPLESDRVSVNDNVYKRNYNYETRFGSFENLPPLSPSAVYLKQDVFRRNY